MDEPKNKIYEFNFTKHLIDILVEFDFDKVHTTMEKLNWEWAHSNEWEGGVPSITDIKRTAVNRLNAAYEAALSNKQKSGRSETGGFRAIVDIVADFVSLEFMVEQWESRNDEELTIV